MIRNRPAVKALSALAAWAALAYWAALGSGHAHASPTTPDIDLKISVAVPNQPVPAGSEGEAFVTLTPPSGIHLNHYPPIRLALDPSPSLVFPQSEIKVGLDKMPDDLDKNPFEVVDPIRVRFRVGENASGGKVQVQGKLRFTYCVAKSGYCAPGTKPVSFTVPVAAAK